MKEILLVFVGGGLGSVLRYLCSVWLVADSGWGRFPWHTFLVNTVGSLLIGFFMGVMYKNPNHWCSFLLVTGFCGGFTTFSTFSLEVLNYFRSGNLYWGLFYLSISLTTCVMCTATGMYFSRFQT